MADKEGFFERMQREEREARLAAGIAELKRRFAAGEFPENEDTINAFSAGFYATYAYQADRREAAGGGEGARHCAALSLLALGETERGAERLGDRPRDRRLERERRGEEAGGARALAARICLGGGHRPYFLRSAICWATSDSIRL